MINHTILHLIGLSPHYSTSTRVLQICLFYEQKKKRGTFIRLIKNSFVKWYRCNIRVLRWDIRSEKPQMGITWNVSQKHGLWFLFGTDITVILCALINFGRDDWQWYSFIKCIFFNSLKLQCTEWMLNIICFFSKTPNKLSSRDCTIFKRIKRGL